MASIIADIPDNALDPKIVSPLDVIKPFSWNTATFPIAGSTSIHMETEKQGF